MLIRKIRNFVNIWGPPLALMMIIFFLSSRQSIAVTHEFTSDFLIFKSMHVIEYGLLTLLIYRSFLFTIPKPTKKQMFIAALCALLYGAFDEFHQTFVPTRTGKPRDIYIDSIGVAIMLSLMQSYEAKINRLLRSIHI